MWILPSILSRCVPAPDNSTSESAAPSPATESAPALWLTLSGKPKRVPFSDRAWKTRTWSPPLFGAAIWKTSHIACFEEWLTGWLQAFPANRTVSPENRKDGTTKGTSSPPSSTSQMEFGLMCSSLKMLPGSKGSSTISPASCFKGGSVIHGVVSAQPMLEPLTGGTGGSASLTGETWPTASACIAQDGESVESWTARRELLKQTANNGNGAGIPLTIAASACWPTANANPGMPNNSTNRGAAHGGRRPRITDQCLETRATGFWPTATTQEHRNTQAKNSKSSASLDHVGKEFWPTASARDWKDTDGMATEATNPDGSHRDRLDQLPRAAVNWGTPTSHERTMTARDVHHGIQLANQAENWGTPRVTTNLGEALQWRMPDAATSGGPRTRTASQGKGHQVVLDEQACHFSPRDPGMVSGLESSQDTLSSLQLYRKWLCGLLGVEYSEEIKWRLSPLAASWLMGWSPFWAVPFQLKPT